MNDVLGADRWEHIAGDLPDCRIGFVEIPCRGHWLGWPRMANWWLRQDGTSRFFHGRTYQKFGIRCFLRASWHRVRMGLCVPV